MANGQPAPSLYCAVIVKRVDEKTRSKTGINELLRDRYDFGARLLGSAPARLSGDSPYTIG